MKTQSNESNSNKLGFNEIIFNQDFVSYINTLSDSIKEFYKVSKNVNKNKNKLINLSEVQLNNIEKVLSKILKEEVHFNEINSLSNIMENLREIFNKLQLNVISEEKNIIFFFEDAKVLFKKMKEKRQELIKKLQKRSNSESKSKYFSSLSSSNNPVQDQMRKFNSGTFDKSNRSEVNHNIKNNISDFQNYKNDNNTVRYKKINNNFNNRKSKTLNKTKESINDEYIDNGGNRLKSSSNFGVKLPENKFIDAKSQNIEIQRLKLLNEKLTIELKKCKSKILEKGNYFFENSLKNESNIKSKDKIILSLKEEKYKNNIKYKELMNKLNNYKNEIIQLKKENSQLKQINILIKKNSDELIMKNNNSKDYEKNLALKLNKLVIENMMLKNNIEELKNFASPRSEYNIKPDMKNLYLDKNNNNTNEKDTLKKSINLTENNLVNMQKHNKELKNEIYLIKKKYETEISKLSKNNSELLSNLKNKQNDLLKFKKEYFNKNKELEKLKTSLRDTKSQNNKSVNSIDNSENYKKEIEELKTTNNLFQDKIKYYQIQLRKIKNDLFEKNQANIELENNNQNQIKDLKEDYEKKISEIITKNKNLENSILESKNYNNDLNKQISDLNQQIVAKDVKILELNYQIEQLQNNLNNKEEENKTLLMKIEKISSNIKENYKKEEIQKLNEKIEEQENLNNDLNEELSNLKNDNELLKNKIMSSERKISDYKKNENKELEDLKNENLALKSNNEKIKNQLKEVLDKNTKDEKIKKQNEEIDGFKQLITKLQVEREKSDEEINVLKKENEKIKNQLIRLSKTLPEEFNELQKQYNDLENKYLQQIKNKSNYSASGKKSKINESDSKNNIEEKLTKELKEAKNEIDIIKKKNLQLVEQLEGKEIKNNCYDNKSEDWNMSNYEEEFDLRKMAKGAREKNRSQDINIDYPGIQAIKEKYRELDFYYNSLETLVKKLLLTIQTNPKNKTYVTELCRIVGFDLETTNKILTNKNKKLLLGLFTK